MNSFTSSLAELLVPPPGNPAAERIVLAPSRRMGRMWLRRVTAMGRALLNVRVETFGSLAARLLGDQLAAGRWRILPREIAEQLAERALRGEGDAEDEASGFLAGLGGALAKAFDDLRRADVTPDDLERSGFESSAEGRAMIARLQRYESLLSRHRYLDSAALVTLAAGELARRPDLLSGIRVIASKNDQATWTPEMWRLWNAVTPEHRAVADCDVAVRPAGQSGLAVESTPQRLAAAMAAGGADLTFFSARGRDIEVRRVLRFCAAEGIALDQVELLYTDRAAYLPVILDQWLSVMEREEGITFLEGVPVSFSRPCRLLATWCQWVIADYDQAMLGRMLLDGLLDLPDRLDARRAAGYLDALPLGFGRERLRRLLDEAARAKADYHEESGDADIGREDRRLAHLRATSDLLEILLPTDGEIDGPVVHNPAGLLRRLLTILETVAHRGDRLDNLARQRLVASLETLAEWHGEHPPASGVDRDALLARLDELARSARVDARGPQPGCLFVAPLVAGAHSGRPWCFVVGMNDDLLPGPLRQDPLLSDRQRQRIADAAHKPLALSWHRGHDATEQFIALVARMRGTLTLSYCRHDIAADREMAPATMLLAAAAAAEGRRWSDLARLEKLCGEPEDFLPREERAALDETRLFLLACQTENRREAPAPSGLVDAIGPESYAVRSYPQLAAGLRFMRDASETHRFLAAAGRVEAVAGDMERPYSPSALESLAACPRRFFFRYLLGVKPPERREPSPKLWLDPLDFGTLVHDAFCEFYRFWVRRFEQAPAAMHLDGAEEVLAAEIDRQIERFKAIVPVPCVNAFNATVAEAREAARLLLSTDRRNFADGPYRPWRFEASIGMPPELAEPGEASLSAEGELEIDTPVAIALATGTLRVRGRLDRIDRSHTEPGEVAIWDYKTGSPAKYEKNPPMNQGRTLQVCLYPMMVKAVLPEMRVGRVGYFFAGRRGRGRMIGYSPAELETADLPPREILGILAGMIRDGSYAATDDVGDCAYCDYRFVCGDVQALARCSRARLETCADARLDGLRRLRGRRLADD